MTSISKHPRTVETVSLLQRQLQKVRHDSLIATRAGDFRKVAQLTLEASRLNEIIAMTEAESQC